LVTFLSTSLIVHGLRENVKKLDPQKTAIADGQGVVVRVSEN
jgi:hypothetical protein